MKGLNNGKPRGEDRPTGATADPKPTTRSGVGRKMDAKRAIKRARRALKEADVAMRLALEAVEARDVVTEVLYGDGKTVVWEDGKTGQGVALADGKTEDGVVWADIVEEAEYAAAHRDDGAMIDNDPRTGRQIMYRRDGSVAEVLDNGDTVELGKGAVHVCFADAANVLRRCGTSSFRVGDVIWSEHDVVGLMRWTVIGIDVDLVDGCPHSLTLMHMPISIFRRFDNANALHPVGRDIWHFIEIRDYLNINFLEGFDEKDRDVMRDARKHTYLYSCGDDFYTSNKLFLLAASEVGFDVDRNGALGVRDEGDAYPFFIEGCRARMLKMQDGDETYWWLRSSGDINGHMMCAVNCDGELTCMCATSRCGVAMACVIG